MHRREFLKTTSGAAAAAAIGGGTVASAVAADDAQMTAPAIAMGARRFILALPQSLDHLEVRTAVQRIAHRLETTLSGPTHISVETTVESGLEAVSTGRADFYFGLDSQHASAHPALPVFAGLALGEDMPASMFHAWLTAGTGRELWNEALGRADAIAFAAGHTGTSPGLYTDVAFETAAALKGVVIAARGIGADALRLLGADVATHAADGIGAIAGRGFAAAEPLLTPFESKAQWSYAPALTPSGLMLSLGTRASLWARLTAADKAVIEGVAAEAYLVAQTHAMQRALLLEDLAKLRRWPVDTHMPDGLATAIERAVSDVADGIAATSAFAAHVIASHRGFRAAMVGRRRNIGALVG